jgi:hypothetical protein
MRAPGTPNAGKKQAVPDEKGAEKSHACHKRAAMRCFANAPFRAGNIVF